MHVTMEDVHVNGYTLPKVDNEMDVDHDYHVHINDYNSTLFKSCYYGGSSRQRLNSAKGCRWLKTNGDGVDNEKDIVDWNYNKHSALTAYSW